MPVTFSSISTSTHPSPAAGGRILIGDFDGDGDADILYQTGANGTAFQYARSNGDGTYSLFAVSSSPFAGLTLPDNNGTNYFAVDFDGDGDLDVIAGANSTTGSYFRNDGGTFTSQSTSTFPAPAAFGRQAFGDFDGDGDTDVLYQTAGNGTAFQYGRNNGNGTMTLLSQAASPFAGLTLPDNGASTYFVADFDRDGDLDVWAAVSNATGSYFRNDSGTFTSQSSAGFPAPAAPARIVVGDFDSDGDVDILYQTGGNGTAFQYARNDGAGTFTTLSQAASPFAGLTLPDHNGSNYSASDIDGDGDADLQVGVNGTTGSTFLANGKPPKIASSTPADNANGASTTADIVITFDESVSRGSGNIYIVRTSDNVVVETIAVGSGQVTGSGTTWTVNPSITLAGATAYAVRLDAGTFVDTDGSIFFGLSNNTTLNFTTAAANTAPTFSNLNGDTAAFTEDAGAIRLDNGQNATVTDSEQANFNGGLLTVAITANRVDAEDVLAIANIGVGAGQISVSGANISYQNVVIGTFTGGSGTDNLVITLDSDATLAATQALIRALTYNNTNSAAPTTSSRTVQFTLTDGAGGTSATQSITVTVAGVDDATVAQDDAVSTNENASLSANVTSNNGSGADSDVDSAVIITAVNGNAGSVGNQITLASGALLILNSNGTFSYNPNGAFNSLAAIGSGASNTTATDSFTYTVTGGDTATVTVNVNGVDGSNDVLQGSVAADTMDGGVGNDILNGGDGDDILSGGTGSDILNGESNNDTLNGGDGSDKLYGLTGQDTLNGGAGNDYMYGGADSDTLSGSDGNDYLDGGTGADSMAGGLANDVYIVDDAGDTTIEAAGEGYDIVRTALEWVLADNIEALELQGSGNVSGTGNAGANNLQGNSGANTLSGLSGVDTINGNGGKDIIIGGTGNDLLRGGAGADSFTVAHAFGGTLETDQIYDFSTVEGDRLDLSGVDADINTGGNQAFTFAAAFTQVAGQMTLSFASGITTVKLDTDGNGVANYQVKINGDVTGDYAGWSL